MPDTPPVLDNLEEDCAWAEQALEGARHYETLMKLRDSLLEKYTVIMSAETDTEEAVIEKMQQIYLQLLDAVDWEEDPSRISLLSFRGRMEEVAVWIADMHWECNARYRDQNIHIKQLKKTRNWLRGEEKKLCQWPIAENILTNTIINSIGEIFDTMYLQLKEILELQDQRRTGTQYPWQTEHKPIKKKKR
ncbi:MAG: hypothetical protein JWM56_512 [Candidatus Peribacteria bacterium]|nr:hypothetical protein [Candidatus Peribacteria bacterium]